MIPPLFVAELEEDEENNLKKVGGGEEGSLNAVISRAPVELIKVWEGRGCGGGET